VDFVSAGGCLTRSKSKAEGKQLVIRGAGEIIGASSPSWAFPRSRGSSEKVICASVGRRDDAAESGIQVS
jgi:hypothetical protein